MSAPRCNNCIVGIIDVTKRLLMNFSILTLNTASMMRQQAFSFNLWRLNWHSVTLEGSMMTVAENSLYNLVSKTKILI